MTNIQDTVTYLDERLGPTFVAYVANTRRRDLVARWKAGEEKPSYDTCRRLVVAAQVLRQVAAEGSDELAYNWFMANNIATDIRIIRPMDAIREDLFDAARASATRFVTDSFY